MENVQPVNVVTALQQNDWRIASISTVLEQLNYFSAYNTALPVTTVTRLP